MRNKKDCEHVKITVDFITTGKNSSPDLFKEKRKMLYDIFFEYGIPEEVQQFILRHLWDVYFTIEVLETTISSLTSQLREENIPADYDRIVEYVARNGEDSLEWKKEISEKSPFFFRDFASRFEGNYIGK